MNKQLPGIPRIGECSKLEYAGALERWREHCRIKKLLVKGYREIKEEFSNNHPGYGKAVENWLEMFDAISSVTFNQIVEMVTKGCTVEAILLAVVPGKGIKKPVWKKRKKRKERQSPPPQQQKGL